MESKPIEAYQLSVQSEAMWPSTPTREVIRIFNLSDPLSQKKLTVLCEDLLGLTLVFFRPVHYFFIPQFLEEAWWLIY